MIPFVIYLLLSIGCVSSILYAFNPRAKVSGLIGITSILGYFTLILVIGDAKLWMILLTIIGVILLIAEAFIPSFGILGLLGLAAVGTGVIQSSPSIMVGVTTLALCFIVSVITLGIMVKRYGFHPIFRKLMLTEEIALPIKDPDAFPKTDMEGVTLTPLRPSGTALINNKKVDVISEGGYIALEKTIKVVKIEGSKVVVREL